MVRPNWALVGLAVAAGATLGGLGLFVARRLTAPVSRRVYDLTIRGVDRSGDQPIVVLDRNHQTAAVGSFCILLESGGAIRLSSKIEDFGPTLIGREVQDEGGGNLDAGMRASWSGIYFLSPQEAGLEATNVDILTEAGPAPAWLIPSHGGPSNTWAIHIHGLGSSRAGTLRGVQVADTTGLTSLVVSSRNDGEGPAVGTGRSELGSAELQDVRAAVRFARDNGAQQVVLFGWSMGGAIALQLATDPALRGVIAGLVLESPILDWVSTIKANCERAGLPAWVGLLAAPWLSSRTLSRVTGLRAPVDLRRFDWIARADELTVPTLILQGRGDTSSPFEFSTRLRSLRPDIVGLEAFDADHTMSWNSDRERWAAVVTAWLVKKK